MAQPQFCLEDHYDGMELNLMREATRHDIEHKFSAAWQAYMSRMFPRPWQLLCEQASDDDGRKRMDFKIVHYDAGEDTVSPAVFVEVERPGGSVRDVEERGLAVAKSAINAYGMTGIYLVTARGLKFRAWYVTRECQYLDPLFGPAQPAQNEMYLDMTSQVGVYELERTIDFMKNERPLRQAPMVPGQQAETNQMPQTGTFHQGERSVAGGHDGGQTLPPMLSRGQYTADFQTAPVS